MPDKPFLALYTIRAKQSYIFRSNRLVEVVGGSETVQDSFDALYTQAKLAGLSYRRVIDGDFNMTEVLAAFGSGQLDAIELSRGGGNDTVLFRGREQFVATNAVFTRYILENHPGLVPLCAGVEVEGKDYREEHRLLMAEVERKKNAMQKGRVENAQPYARQDRSTLQAIAVEIRHGNEKVQYRTAEADAKYQKGLSSIKTEAPTKYLDDLAREENQSLLAIIHADINRLGIKNQKKLKKIEEKIHKQQKEEITSDYTDYVNAIRAFDAEIRYVVIDQGKAAVEKRRCELEATHPEEAEKRLRVRWIVHEGDDITFLCNAKYALALTKAYLLGVKDASDGKEETYSACAGICVFHSHYPFYRAYALAEQACDNAKKEVHKANSEQAWLDFHYLRSGVNGELEDIRKLHRTQDCIARPWFVCGAQPEADALRLEQLEQLNQLLHDSGVKRSQIKDFGAEFEVSKHAGELVWKRICYNAQKAPKLNEDAEKLFLNRQDALFRALYDLSDFYDLWFKRGGDEDD